MRATKTNDCNTNERLCVSMPEFALLLGTGRATAEKISVAAGAKIKIGSRVLVKLNKVNAYLDSIAE